MWTRTLIYAGSMLLFLLGSCIPMQRMQIEVAVPPEFLFPPQTDSILVLNIAYYPESTGKLNAWLNELEAGERYILDTIFIRNTLSGFFEVADKAPVPRLNGMNYLEDRASDTLSFMKPLSAESVRDICKTNKADALIALEFTAISAKNNYTWYSDEEYSYAQVYRMTETALLWRAYERDSGMMKEFFVRDSLYFTSEAGTYSMAESRLPDITESFREAGWSAGIKSGKKFTPYWATQSRKYFYVTDITGKDSSLDSLVLKEYIGYGKKIRKYKSLYNMALVYEMNGRTDKAKATIDEALRVYPESAEALAYRAILNRRLKEVQKLQ